MSKTADWIINNVKEARAGGDLAAGVYAAPSVNTLNLNCKKLIMTPPVTVFSGFRVKDNPIYSV